LLDLLYNATSGSAGLINTRGKFAMTYQSTRLVKWIFLAAAGMVFPALCFADEHQQRAYEIYKYLIEADTTYSTGDTAVVAEKLASRLREEGIPGTDIHVIKHAERKGSLVARIRSTNPQARPLLLLAHLDVVEADPADWSMDPMTLNEDEDYFYGRGTLDDKNQVAIHMANFIKLHRDRTPLKRDLIIAFTADEEGGPNNGVIDLLANHRELIDADLVFNEGGGGLIRDGKYIANTVQTAEKVYQSYALEITNPGGHSSLPRSDNAIYQLANALTRIESYEFPMVLNATTRAYFSGSAALEEGETADHLKGLLQSPPAESALAHFRDNPAVNARLRTTCVATQLEAGHAENALPQRARAVLNCRVLPGIPLEEVQQTLLRVAATEGMAITPIWDSQSSAASPLSDEIMVPIKAITLDMWPGTEVLPTMSTGATDAVFFRNAGIPVYGVSGIFVDESDNRAHGRDERLLKQSFYEGLEFLYRLTLAVAGIAAQPAE
jgi:acetylornithine deacetylase/succinyl-diaminopimelate desuccinylase-like protein